MRKLHFVGVSDDGAHLLLQDTTNVREQFLLPIDERVRAASRGDRSRLGQIEIELESSLRPREIQARIRAGESPEEVAAAANAPLQRVMRFAYPVLQEREQVTVEARRTRIRRSDGALQLGEQVDDRLTRQGIDPETTDWDAYRREDGTWWLSLSWMAGKTPRQAQWSFDLAGRTLTPADDLAAELQAEQPRRRQIAAVPFVPDDEPDEEPAEQPTPRPTAERWSEQQARSRPAREDRREQRPEPARETRPEERDRSAASERRETSSVRESNSVRESPSVRETNAKRDPNSKRGANPVRETNSAPARTTNGAERPRPAETGPTRAAKPERNGRPVETARATKNRLEPERRPRPSSEPYGWAAPAVDEDEARSAAPAPAEEQVPDESATRPAATGRAAESTESEAAEPDTRKSGRSRKPKVPSWDDIVFGTRSQR